MRLLLAEDERTLSDALTVMLTHSNYSVDAVYNGQDALDYLEAGNYDCAVLDVMMPKMDGITVLKNIRAKGINIPVLLLTAKSEIDDRVEGLDSGADDYMTKPFSSEELLARIRSLSRRNASVMFENVLQWSDLTLNLSTYELFCGERSFKLGLKEFSMMELFLKNGSRILSKETLIIKIWGYESDAENNNVEVYVSFLRKKLAHMKSKVAIKTVRGVGYCLEEKE
jgi:DNA-binding response OmpR family regulator